jgi:hypothetical protein
LGREIARGLNVHQNIKVEVIVTTIDKARLCLIETHSHSASMTNWAAPLGIFASLLATLIVADFRDFGGLPKAFWADAFKYATGATGLWLAWELYRVALILRTALKAGLKSPVDRFIAALKAGSEAITLQSVGPDVSPTTLPIAGNVPLPQSGQPPKMGA